jgi:hypothetical protein
MSLHEKVLGMERNGAEIRQNPVSGSRASHSTPSLCMYIDDMPKSHDAGKYGVVPFQSSSRLS